MPAKPLDSILMLWSAAYLGAAFFLLAGLLPQGTVSIGLLAQLSWLALIGSIPTTLALAATSRLAAATRPTVMASTLVLVALTMAVGYEHVDFLLSGPRWLDHPRRILLQVAMLSMLGLLSGSGWLWLILGVRLRRGSWQAIWIALSIVVVGLLTAAIVRFRAYDYSMAQLVFPAGLLSGAILYLIIRSSPRRFMARRLGHGLSALWRRLTLRACAGSDRSARSDRPKPRWCSRDPVRAPPRGRTTRALGAAERVARSRNPSSRPRRSASCPPGDAT